jgi:hypothetical protein
VGFRPVYGDFRLAVQREMNFPPEIAGHMLPYNAHPPVSVVLTLPFGQLSYPNAILVWNLLGIGMYLAALILVIRGLALPFHRLSLLPIGALSLAAFPLYSQFSEAQFNLLLLVLILGAWQLDQRGRFAFAGTLVGIAAAVKLFPAFLFLYFLVQRRGVALLAGGATFVVLNLVATVLLGVDDMRSYVLDVVPSVTQYVSGRLNASLAGFCQRVFDPNPREHVVGLMASPMLAHLTATVTRLLIVIVVAWAGWKAANSSERNRAWAIAITGMLLVSPITWPHYFVMLLLPLGFVWYFAHGRLKRIAFWFVFVPMLLPVYYFPNLVMGPERGNLVYLRGESVVSVRENLLAASVPAYALLGLFVLVVCVRPNDEPTTAPPIR